MRRAEPPIPTWLRIAGQAARVGYVDYTSIMTLRIWLSGMFLRMLAQVSFFALIGKLLGSQRQVTFLLVGNAVSLASMMSLVTIASTTWERRQGTLPLIVSSPTSPGLVFIARSVHWVAEGWVSAVGALVVTSLAFGLRLPLDGMLWALPLIALVGASTYLFGCCLAALVLEVMDLRNVVSNVVYVVMVAACGVVVPVSTLPVAVRVVAEALPLTHGLAAIHMVLDGRSIGTALPQIAAEVAIGAGWLLLAVGAFALFVERGRRRGTIELST